MGELKAGDLCPYCFSRLVEVVCTDLRSSAEKKKSPLTVKELTVLNCLCLHPGDLTIGGFF
jgi:hypothetical protein